MKVVGPWRLVDDQSHRVRIGMSDSPQTSPVLRTLAYDFDGQLLRDFLKVFDVPFPDLIFA